MYFFIDSKDNTVTAFSKLGVAAKFVLEKIGVAINSKEDPVKQANKHLDNRGVILNLSSAFLSISDSDDVAAQELAKQFHEAIERHYAK